MANWDEVYGWEPTQDRSVTCPLCGDMAAHWKMKLNDLGQAVSCEACSKKAAIAAFYAEFIRAAGFVPGSPEGDAWLKAALAD